MQLDLLPELAVLPAKPKEQTLKNYIRPLYVGERVDPEPVDKPELAFAYWNQRVQLHPFYDADKEHLVVMILNTKLRIFAWNMVSIGSLNECLAHPRDILRPVIAAAGYAFILAHNHPSGDPSPSEADRRLTVRISEAARLMQISFLDHVIVGQPAAGRTPYFSFREAGVI